MASELVKGFTKKKKKVMDHIKLYLTESSHYSRSRNPHRRYLSSVLTINKMHEQYKVWCTKNNFIPVCASMYRNIFNTEFNLGFGSPRIDTCAKCDAGTAADDHKQMADAGFRSMADDRKKARESDDIHYITFALQKNTSSSEAKYKHFLLLASTLVIQSGHTLYPRFNRTCISSDMDGK